MLPLIINLVTGAVGGNVAGALLKNFNMGTLWNSVCGILGGGMGAGVLGALGLMGGGDGSLAIGNIIASIASGTIGGGGLMAIVGVIRQVLGK